MSAPISFSKTAPAVTFQNVTGGTRVRREGKGDHLFITRDERCRGSAWLIIQHGVGVVGRVCVCDGDWFVEYGVFRGYEPAETNTVRVEYYRDAEDAMTEAAMWFCS